MSTEPDITVPPEDATPHIRTYAKDFAAASGKNPPESAKPKRAPKKKEVKKEKEVAPIPPAPVPASTPSIPPTVPVATHQEVSAEISTSEREAILARLKARASTQATGSLPTYLAPERAPLSQIPLPTEPAPIQEAAPLIPIPEPLPPEPVISYREPVPAPIEIPPEPVQPEPAAAPVIPEGPAPLHTYTSDFADRIDEKKASRFSVLAAENDAHVRTPQTKKKVSLLPILSGILLLIIGSGAIVAAYIYMSKSAPVLSIIAPPSLIAPDSKVALTGTGSTLFQALATQAGLPLQANTVELTYINVSTTTTQGVLEEPGTGGAFITEMNLPAPDILLRNIDPSSMVGIVSAGQETRPFFILRVTSYERTFAGMLSWEGTMSRDLAQLYPRYSTALPAPIVTTVATTTSATTTKSSTTKTTSVTITSAPTDPSLPVKQFVDETVTNHDARALKDISGRTIVLYGYADKQTLIICRDEAAFSLLLGRLAASNQ